MLVQEHFTANNSLIFISRKSTEVNYASILAVSNTETPLELEIRRSSKVEEARAGWTVTQDTAEPRSPQQGMHQEPGLLQSPHPLLFAWKSEQGPQPENLHLPHLQPSWSDHQPGQHPGRILGESMGLIQVLLQAEGPCVLQYYLKTGEGEENERSKAWMIHF